MWPFFEGYVGMLGRAMLASMPLTFYRAMSYRNVNNENK